MRRCALLVVICVTLLAGQQPDTSLDDGRFWRSSPPKMRIGFLIGYVAGLTNGLANFTSDEKDIQNRIRAAWPDLTNGEIEEAISRFYDAPENRPFLVSVAIQAIAMNSKGMPQARIDSFLNRLRQQQLASVLRPCLSAEGDRLCGMASRAMTRKLGSVESAKRKLARAAKHLKSIKSRIAEYSASRPYK